MTVQSLIRSCASNEGVSVADLARSFSRNTSQLRDGPLCGRQIHTAGKAMTQPHEVMGITCGIIGEYFNYPRGAAVAFGRNAQEEQQRTNGCAAARTVQGTPD